MISGETNLRNWLRLWLIGKPVFIVLEDTGHTNASAGECNQTNGLALIPAGAGRPAPGMVSAVGEIHGHFKADTQVGVGGFGPHGSVPLVMPGESGTGINTWVGWRANATFERTGRSR